MFKDIFNDIWLNYRGRFLCTLTGFVIAALFLLLGFWQTLFLLLFVAGGFFIGYKIDKKEDLVEWLTGFCRRVIIDNWRLNVDDSQNSERDGIAKLVPNGFH